jgi:hypothetical protein
LTLSGFDVVLLSEDVEQDGGLKVGVSEDQLKYWRWILRTDKGVYQNREE